MAYFIHHIKPQKKFKILGTNNKYTIFLVTPFQLTFPNPSLHFKALVQ